MASVDPSVRPTLHEDLVHQADWLRHLARSLVRDDPAAEEIAQDTLLVALRHPPSDAAALRPWLRRVAHNLIRMRSRREQLLQRIPLEAEPAARVHDDVTERLEMQKILTEELERLEEPLRRALVRRYLEGKSAARIARDEGIPASTVRARIQRGLERMRARLEQRRGRGTWQLALLPLCKAPASLAPGLLTRVADGVLAMKIGSHLVTACALLVAAGLGAWWLTTSPSDPATPTAPTSHAANEQLVAPEPATIPLDADTRAGARELVASTPASPAPASTAPAEGIARVTARCIDPALQPLAGVVIADDSHAQTCRSTSDADGRVVLDVALEAPRMQRVLRFESAGRAAQFVEAHLVAGDTTRLGDIVLAPGGSVSGRVTDETGRAVEGARVIATLPDIWGELPRARLTGPRTWPGVPSTTSGPGGVFHLDGIGVGPHRVWGAAPGRRWAVTDALEIRAQVDLPAIVLVLEPELGTDRIRGRVIDPEGQPVAQALVRGSMQLVRGKSISTLRTEADGSFDFAVFGTDAHELTASDPSGRFLDAPATTAQPGARDVALRLRAPQWTNVEVRSSGKPVTRFALVTRSADGTTMIEGTGEIESPDGHRRIRAPTVSYLIQVIAPGYALAARGPFDPEHPPESLQFDLDTEPGLSGHVTSGGQPVAGARVELYAVASPHVNILNSYPGLVEHNALDRTQTDSAGSYSLRVRESGRFVVRTEAEGSAPADSGPVALTARSASVVDLQLTAGGTIEGRVLTAPGRDPAGILVAANRGDAHVITMRSDEQGRFRFTRLTPGPWLVARGNVEIFDGMGIKGSWAGEESTIAFNCDVQAGATTSFDIDLRDWSPCEIHGRLSVNGAPAKAWVVTAWPGNGMTAGGPPPSCAVSGDGAFVLALPEPAKVKLNLAPPAEINFQGSIDAPIDLHTGTNAWQMDLALGRIEGRFATPPSKGTWFLMSETGAIPEWRIAVAPDAEGRFAANRIPTGRGSVQRMDYVDRRVVWIRLAEFEVRAQDTAHVEVH